MRFLLHGTNFDYDSTFQSIQNVLFDTCQVVETDDDYIEALWTLIPLMVDYQSAIAVSINTGRVFAISNAYETHSIWVRSADDTFSVIHLDFSDGRVSFDNPTFIPHV